MVQHYQNLTGWFHDYVTEQRSAESVAEIYAEDGGAGLVREVCENASSDISEELANGNTHHRAFNSVAGKWPYKAKQLLAAYEHAEQDRDDDRYINDLIEFTEDVPFDEMVAEEIQTTLGPHFADNPFEDDDLTRDEAKAVMAARVHHDEEMTDEQVAGINHLGNFLEALQQCDGIEEAIRAHRFDQSLPDGLRGVLAHPDEWDDLQPTDIPTRQCGACNTNLYEVYHADEGRCFVTRDGDIQETHDIGDATNGDAFYATHTLYESSRDGDSVMCGSCMNNWETQASCLCIASGDGDYVCLKFHDGYTRDEGLAGNAENAVPMTTFTDDDNFVSTFFGGYVGLTASCNTVSFSPNEGPAPDNAVSDAMEHTFEHFGADVPECRVALFQRRNYDGQLGYFIEVPRDSPKGARWAKELLESPELTTVSA